MATIAPMRDDVATSDAFFRTVAIAMALTIVTGFGLHFLMGRSSLDSRPLVHMHGLAFMGWTMLFATQASLATAGSRELHKRLGWIGTGWAALLLVMGLLITIDVARRGTTPFFFRPQYFIIANPLTLLCFVGLFAWAIRNRRRTDWHKRLQICATTAIIGPAFGRLLPMPLMGDYAFEIAVLAGLIFPIAGMVRDRRRDGKVHPAWWRGTLAILLVLPLSHIIANSELGEAIYAFVTAGYPGANAPGLEFGTPPPGMI